MTCEGGKLKVLAICKYEGPAQQFLDLASLFPYWDASALLLFSDPALEAQLERAGVRCSRFPVSRFLFEIPYLNLAARILLDGYHFIASFWLYRRHAADVDVLFNMDSNPFGPGKWLARWARRAGTLTLRWSFANIPPGGHKEHFITERYLRMLGFEVDGLWGARSHTDYTLIGAPNNKHMLAQAGVSEDRLPLVGSYLYDKLVRLRRNGQPGEGILILSQPFGPDARETIFRLAAALEGIPGSSVTIKLHPRDDADSFASWATARPGVRIARHGEEAAEDLIAKARVVIGFTSTTLAAALFLNKPVIFYRYQEDVATADFYARYVRGFSLHGLEDLADIRRDISQGELAHYEQEVLPGAIEALFGQPGFAERFDAAIASLLESRGKQLARARMYDQARGDA
jgi:hypothetical protein